MRLSYLLTALYILLPFTLQAETFSSTSISAVSIFDHGNLTGEQDLSIDVVRGTCGAQDQNGDGDTTDPEDVKPEPFGDTILSVTINNQSNVAVLVSRLYYRLPHGKGKLRQWMGGLAPVSGGYIPAKTSKAVSFFAFKANAAGKNTFKPSIALVTSLGFQDLSVKLDAKTSSGRLLRLTESVGVSFGNEDRCTAG